MCESVQSDAEGILGNLVCSRSYFEACHPGSRSTAREKTDEASKHIDLGLKLIAIIDSLLPHYKVSTEIKSGALTYVDEDDVVPNYVTVFEELERRDIISPIVQAKRTCRRNIGSCRVSKIKSRKWLILLLR